MATPILSPLTSVGTAGTAKKLKSGNLTYSTGNVFYPTSVEEVQQLVKKHSKLKSPWHKALLQQYRRQPRQPAISTSKMNKVVSIDPKGSTVTVEMPA